MGDDPKKPLTAEEAMAKIKEIAENGEIKSASVERISLYEKHVDVLMLAMGMPEKSVSNGRFFVSDESTVSDFSGLRVAGTAVDAWLVGVVKALKMDIKLSDKIVDIAERLRNRSSN